MSNFSELVTTLQDAAKAAANAATSALKSGDTVRHAVGNVILEGVSTNAALACAVPIEIAIAVERRMPFANSESICKAARDAAKNAGDFMPYLITLDTLFADPAANAYDAAYTAATGVPVGLISLQSAIVKSTVMLTLLADTPDLASATTDFEQDVKDLAGAAEDVAKQLFPRVQGLFDPKDLFAQKPFDDVLIDKLGRLKTVVDGFMDDTMGQVGGQIRGVLAGVPKIFYAAQRGAQRMQDAVDTQVDLLCGQGRQPARAFYDRRKDTISLDRTYPSIASDEDSWALLVAGPEKDLYRVNATSEQSRAEFGLSGKTTELRLDAALERYEKSVRQLTVFADSDKIAIGEIPDPEPVTGDTILLETLSGDLAPHQLVIFSGIDDATGKPAASVRSIASVTTQNDNRTQIVLTEPLNISYRRATLRINANVAPATHGESIREILGSGNAATRHQRFILKQAPLTHIAADTDSGRASTLTVTVNDLKWSEVPTLVGRGPRDRVYSTRADGDGKTTVQFGDGREGALPPSGPNNVRAAYRKGIGFAGNLATNKLTTLLTRPAGVASVSNPIATEGGEDPEAAAETRENAPMTVRTMGRVVSLTDYEDFAVTFAGIGKARASWAPGGHHGIVLTLAAADGTAIGDSSETRKKLLLALRNHGDPLLPIHMVSFRPVQFTISGTLTIADDREPDIVVRAVERALDASFSFKTMQFGESISIDDVMAAIHTVDGVVAVDIDAFYRTTDAAQWNARLDVAPATFDPALGWQGAELLTITPGAGTLGYVQLKGAV